LKRTTEVVTKFDPFTVKTKVASPTVLLVGSMSVTAGTRLLTVKLTAEEVPPAGVGLNTVIGKLPPVCTSAAVICAVNWVELTRVAGRLLPLKRTIELPLKLVPLTVNTKSASPAILLAGEMLLTVGTGLLTVRFTAVVLPPLGAGLKTVIG
jgi:hypothetical protein